MLTLPQIVLDPKVARRFDGRHPWVMANSLIEPTVGIEAGETVDLVQANGSWIGRGIYNPNSRIRLRLLQWSPDQELSEGWIREQLDRALQLRLDWMTAREPFQAYRVANSEGDGLSGLNIDRFADYVVIQFTSLAMFLWKDVVLNWCQAKLQPTNMLVTMEAGAAKQEGLEPFSYWTEGTPESPVAAFREFGVELQVDLNSGQKTGYYLDQRSNRLHAAKQLQPGSMLDVCCYHAGFSMTAVKQSGVSEVLAVDTSEKALQSARAQVERNGLTQIQLERADCFDYLKQLHSEGRFFDNVVLDPPRMASHRSQIDSALRAYYRLNLSAVNVLRSGGTLVTCSCSGRILREDLWGILSSVAKRTRRRIQVIESRGADFDHPVDVNCPESEYLKCFLCRVN